MKYDQNLLVDASRFALDAHFEQKRDDNITPYYHHPEAVAHKLRVNGYSILYQICGWLHDIIEDTRFCDDDLEAKFGPRVTKIVRILTRRSGEDYFRYIRRVKTNKTATIVKYYDLEHNMQDLKEGSRLDKYRFAQFMLMRKQSR